MNAADTHRAFATLDREAGDTDAAQRHASAALNLSTDISHRRGQAEAHTELGLIAADPTAAHRHFTTALDLYRRLGISDKADDLTRLLGK
ncbi:hypothetical protein [Actinoallomurus iriomotensis]|uniref:Tetratricopeptide repeat protein n=1 Tax=Actinoallomurus iriomotensis TaxID=478107 RepID=A0A9W6RN51_9ACTN|nr:hypothetical protein [Actinoallomurus iriomotensis]GLY76885.1 hypothetical protein Airi01_051520 [Actinoallomurus iriomotensis]